MFWQRAFVLALLPVSVPLLAQSKPAAEGVNPYAGNAEMIEEGQQIYNLSCTACHGHNGEVGDRAPALAATRRYMRNTDKELFDAIRSGIPGTAMPPSSLSPDDAWKVAAFIKSLRSTAIDTPANGDVAHGEQIFWGKGECGNCHMLHGKGGLMGPDLSNIAAQRKLSALRAALTVAKPKPSPGYVPVRITAKDGQVVSGILKNEHNFSYQALGSDNELHVFTRDQVKEVVYSPKPLMPSDYGRRFSAEEMQDLLAFLSRQGPRKTREGPRR